jgi:hypothetical protein
MSTLGLQLPYTGADIVATIVEANERKFGGPGSNRRFVRLDLTSDPLPQADVVLCRDCLVHLSFANIFRAFANIRRSGARYLLTTTFLDHHENADIEDGDWRILNLVRAPFNLPAPVDMMIEGCREGDGAYADKALGLWEVASLPGGLKPRRHDIRERDSRPHRRDAGWWKTAGGSATSWGCGPPSSSASSDSGVGLILWGRLAQWMIE